MIASGTAMQIQPSVTANARAIVFHAKTRVLLSEIYFRNSSGDDTKFIATSHSGTAIISSTVMDMTSSIGCDGLDIFKLSYS